MHLVATASVVISGRLLWVKHGLQAPDESAVAQCISLLEKAQVIFRNLSRHSPLVLGCSRYLLRLSDMILKGLYQVEPKNDGETANDLSL
jgi:hypothetical protein